MSYGYGYPGYYRYPGYPGYYNQPYMNNYYNHHHHYHHWNQENEYPMDHQYSHRYNNYNYYNNPNNYEEEKDNNYENNNMENYYQNFRPYHSHYNYQYPSNKGEENYTQCNKEEAKDNKKEKKEKTNDELILDYENSIRKEIEQTTPLISEELNIGTLIDEYKSNEEYAKSVENISKKYKFLRKIRRDGNCFYRAFIFRLFEHICIKNDKALFEKIKQKILDVKELTGRNGYDWVVVEDFYDLFLKEFTDCFNSLTFNITVRDYLDALFIDKDKGNYLIYFIRFCIASYLKENKEKYQLYIEGPFDNWVRNEVEAIDHEADEIQIMACVNYFDIGVKIEYLNKDKREVVKMPDDKPDDEFFIFLLFTPGHYDILYP